MTRAHAKKRSTKRSGGRKRSQSGGAGPEGISEEMHDEAVRVLRAEYYQGVRGIAQELGRAVKDGKIKNQDDWETWIHQTIDGSYWVIYTHANFQVLMCSDHHDEYSEQYGQAPVEGDSINWAVVAFAALERDVRDQLSAEGIEPDWDNFEGMNEAPRARFGRVVEAELALEALPSEGVAHEHVREVSRRRHGMRLDMKWTQSAGGTGWRGTDSLGRTYLLRRAGARHWNLHIEGRQYGPFDSLADAKREAGAHANGNR